jgi:hypothetical protein
MFSDIRSIPDFFCTYIPREYRLGILDGASVDFEFFQQGVTLYRVR